MSERFFVEHAISGGHARLVDAEAQHLVKVMRAKTGDEVVVFDGSGAEFLARVQSISRQAVELEIAERRAIDRELPHQLTIAVGLPKGDRQQWLVEKLTELGATRLVPLICQRSVALPVESAVARMQRWVIEASKQCGRNRLMEIAPPQRWTDFAASAPPEAVRLFAHTSEELASSNQAAGAHVMAAVGPEGGWSDEEVAIARAQGWQIVTLGPRILRVETAALALAARLSQGGSDARDS